MTNLSRQFTPDNFPENDSDKIKESAFLVPNSPQSTLEANNAADEEEDEDEMHTIQPISLMTIMGGVLIPVTVGLAIIGACIFRYPVTVIADASIRPRGELKLVQAATEGSIIRIFVQENQKVHKGDIIAKLDDSRLQTQKSQLQLQLQQYNLELERIKSQIFQQDSQIFSETERIRRTISSAQAELERITRNHLDQQKNTIIQVREAQANLNSSQQEWRKSQSEYRSSLADLQSAEAAFKAAIIKRSRYQKALEEGVISEDTFQETELNTVQKEQAVTSQKGVIAAKKQTIEQQHQAVLAAKARLETAKVALNPSDAEVKAQRQRIAEEQAKGNTIITNLKKERNALIQQQIRTNQQIENTQKEIRQVELLLRKTVINSPVDGILFNLNLRNVNQTVQQGTEIAKIVPSQTPLVIKAQVTAADIGKVKIEQKVQMKVSACPYPDYGTLKGRVSLIAPDAILETNPSLISSNKKNESVSRFYEVTIEPDNLTLNQAGKICNIQLGMNGKADIISRDETLMQFLLRKARLITDF